MASARRRLAETASFAFDGVSLERASTAEQVAAEIRRQLLSGEVAPGTKVSDQAVAAGLGVSRNTAREAILILVAEGLLTRQLHKGVEVTELGLEELNDVYRARQALELVGLQFMAQEREQSLPELRETLAAMDRSAAVEDTQALLDADRQFHEVIIKAIGSRRVSRFYRLIQTEIRLTRAWYGARMAAPAFVQRHREIVDAIEAGNDESSRALLERLINDGQVRLQEQLMRSDGA
jgi:DNA-binding GntR family transcriptional regulator